MISHILLLATLALEPSSAFVAPTCGRLGRIQSISSRAASSPEISLEEARELKAKAERMRLEAEQMDVALTLEKIKSLEKKLNDGHWLERHPEDESDLKQQLEDLNNRLQGKPPRRVTQNSANAKESSQETATRRAAATQPMLATTAPHDDSRSPETSQLGRQDETPVAGFSQKDLELYLPVAEEIEKRLSTALMSEKLEAFRSAPELQDHFQAKIQSLLVGPLEDMQRIENLKSQYLSTNSQKEKMRLKREIDKIESTMNQESPYLFGENSHKEVLELTEEEIQKRVDNIEKLPPVLQALYKKRNDLQEDGDLRLAVLLEHCEPQIQLLNQVTFVTPLPETFREEAMRAYDSLPQQVKDHFAVGLLGLEAGADASTVVQKLEGNKNELASSIGLKDYIQVTNPTDPSEYSDIEFMDRSRFVEELMPAFARMEIAKPDYETIDAFCSEILDKNSFVLTSKPERVMGGYYLRGENRIKGDGANDELVARLMKKLEKSPLREKLQFFFIPDTSPTSEEDLEMGVTGESPLLAVTSKELSKMYDISRPRTKFLVSAGGLFSLVVFALGSCGMNSATFDKLEAAANSGIMDLTFLTDMVVPIIVSAIGILLAHEIAHRIVACKDKFSVGLPNIIPSLQLGVTGAITPLTSPPKNLKSLFDFSIAGPLAGFTTSLVLLCLGLGMTASMDLSAQSQLPALPVELLRSSALGGELVEWFLGGGVLTSRGADLSALPLHPFAIAGYVGLLGNALSLLPLGNTDGGRISLAMFGRRLSFLIKTFSTFALCVAGLFGFDDSQILLVYVLFTIIWQRELEAPVLNEVDDLDVTRGIVGIASALMVTLTLLPLP